MDIALGPDLFLSLNPRSSSSKGLKTGLLRPSCDRGLTILVLRLHNNGWLGGAFSSLWIHMFCTSGGCTKGGIPTTGCLSGPSDTPESPQNDRGDRPLGSTRSPAERDRGDPLYRSSKRALRAFCSWYPYQALELPSRSQLRLGALRHYPSLRLDGRRHPAPGRRVYTTLAEDIGSPSSRRSPVLVGHLLLGEA